jgi:hypothetical protein
MSRTRYWLCAAIPLVVALTTGVRADGAEVVLTGVRGQGTLVSLEAKDMALAGLAGLLTEALGCEVRIEGQASGTISLSVKDVSPATLLSQSATALGGRWQVIYRLSTKEPAPTTVPVLSGISLKLEMPDVSCHAASSVVARMAGAKVERDGELTGQVSLVGAAMPVEDAMDAIAKASGASWRRIYVMRVDALPQAPTTRQARATPDKTDEPEPKAKPKRKPDPKLFSSHPSPTGSPSRGGKRDRTKPSMGGYLPGVKPMQATLEEIEKHAMLGLYGSFFLFESEAARSSAMRNFQAGLESQLRRLEQLPASQRRVTTMMTRRNFDRLVEDFRSLNDDQKKEAQELFDFAKEQLTKPPLLGQ